MEIAAAKVMAEAKMKSTWIWGLVVILATLIWGASFTNGLQNFGAGTVKSHFASSAASEVVASANKQVNVLHKFL